MVEGNEHQTNRPDPKGAPKRRGGLFGGRRGRGRGAQPAAETQVAAPEVDEASVTVEEAPEAPSPGAASEHHAGRHVASGVDADSAVATDTGDESGTADASQADSAADDAVETPAPAASPIPANLTTTSLIFHAPPVLVTSDRPERPERGDRPDRAERGDRGDRSDLSGADHDDEGSSVRRRTRRRTGEEPRSSGDQPANTVVKVRTPREPELITEPQRVKGSTRLEAKKQRRRDGRDAGRRRTIITESEFLARRESVDRSMIVREKSGRIQIGVLEDGVLVEHYVARNQDASLIGNVYLGRVQNVLPSMEAAFVDIGRGRNAVLYSGEVDWDAAAENGEKNQPRRIELALKPGDRVLVQVTKDPVGHKGARLTSQISLPGRYLVYVPNGSMNGISRKLPDTERARLKKILKEVLPENQGVIVRTAAEGATEEQLTLDVNRLLAQWADISAQLEKAQAPSLLHSEPDLLIKIVRDVFNEDFQKMIIEGDEARGTIERYLRAVAPDLLERVEAYEGDRDSFDSFRISEQIEKALDRKVWLPSGGSLVIDRTEAMTVVDVNTGKFVGSGGNLEETVTKNNLEAAEEIVRQLRLRDIGGIIVVDFIDMVLESNRDLVLRRLIECLSRDRTKHQVAEVTSLGLVQMTRKKLGLGLLETFSEPCEVCAGRGIVVHHEPVFKHRGTGAPQQQQPERRRGGRGNTPNSGGGSSAGNGGGQPSTPSEPKAHTGTHAITEDVKHALAQIAASTIPHAEHHEGDAPASAGESAASTTSDSTSGESKSGEESASGGRQGRRRGRGRRASREQTAVAASEASAPQATNDESAPDAAAHEVAPSAPETTTPDAGHPAAESAPAAAVAAILDLPVVAAPRTRPEPAADTADLLDSVLDALPAPKKAGEGRSRSRRVSTAALSPTGGAPVITRGDGSGASVHEGDEPAAG
ncbi:ribonuclease E/G [Agromyces sp. Leaf222]|uniref:ribonuclease E/G n=1 Tax=Agromyces sp. Leaf222 TaxID=1735688 RepID=UPI0006F26390|nr:ribonuclease E/G [Agromyces sp. Leaf222]KQM83409.1 ribonuclease G [Agromyces sp. Leaf222]